MTRSLHVAFSLAPTMRTLAPGNSVPTFAMKPLKFASDHKPLLAAHSVLIVDPGSTAQCQLFGPTQSMPFRDRFDPWRFAGEGLHARKVSFVYPVFPVALRGSYSHAPGNEEFVEQEDNISILPRVAADPGAPVDRAELSAIHIPLIGLCVAVGLIEPWITLGPCGNILVLEERLFADHKALLTRFHVLLDRLLHPVSVSAAVGDFLEVFTEAARGV